MSVLVKGMKMPKNCMLCSFCVEEADPRNGEMCLVTGKLMPPCNHERLDDCPLIQVPQHGRLIDADALLADVRAHSESYFADDFAHEWVDVAPTVIESESYSEWELQRDYEASVEYAQHCGRYEPTYDQDIGAM